MADMTTTDTFLREQLLHRRQRLEAVVAGSRDHNDLVQLLGQVDSALERMDSGAYGICEVCHESVEKERLLADPLVRYCLDHLTPADKSALEYDLQLASQMQREMLPEPHLTFNGWEIAYHYRPLGPVSGDYCDVVRGAEDRDSLFFAIGDASGKGVAASMLMAHLHAIFRALIASDLPLPKVVEQASRIFCESAMAPYFATLVCGRAGASGEIELCNAGHCPPLMLRDGEVTRIEATGVPLGLFCEGSYSARTAKLGAGDSLLLYTDGLSEARNRSGEEYGDARLAQLASGLAGVPSQALVGACLEDVTTFQAGAPLADDMTVMVIRRLN